MLAAAATVAITAVVVAAVVASAGTAGAAIGIGVSMAVGASGAAATTIATVATVGCYTVAGMIATCGLSDVGEIFTGRNIVRDTVFKGDQEAYDDTKKILSIAAFGTVELAANNPGLAKKTYQEEYIENKQYDSYREFLKENGKAGEDMEWHHIVEQCQTKESRSGLNPRDIYSTRNTIALDKETHKLISKFYSSRQEISDGQVFRNWLNGKSFEEQLRWGIKILRLYGVEYDC